MKKHTTRTLRAHKLQNTNRSLQMLTCYDFQTAQLLNETSLDLILVGDSVGNVILGHETTVEVTLDEMIIFGKAVTKGANQKFVIVDLPFGSYATVDMAVKNGIKLFQQSKAQALKLEGAFPSTLKAIESLTQTGIPIMGHIGLTPQSVHEQGGYYMHGKNDESAKRLIEEANSLYNAGVFSLVLECVTTEIATEITQRLPIPTIGIGSGAYTDGQVLVINDLLKMGRETPPKFCNPVADLYEMRINLIEEYLKKQNENTLN